MLRISPCVDLRIRATKIGSNIGAHNMFFVERGDTSEFAKQDRATTSHAHTVKVD